MIKYTSITCCDVAMWSGRLLLIYPWPEAGHTLDNIEPNSLECFGANMIILLTLELHQPQLMNSLLFVVPKLSWVCLKPSALPVANLAHYCLSSDFIHVLLLPKHTQARTASRWHRLSIFLLKSHLMVRVSTRSCVCGTVGPAKTLIWHQLCVCLVFTFWMNHRVCVLGGLHSWKSNELRLSFVPSSVILF